MSRATGRKQHRSKVDRRAVERRTMASSTYVGPIDRRVMDRRAAERRTIGLGSLRVRHWTVIAGVSVIALGAGVLVAGVPSPSDAFVIPADATSTTVVESAAVTPVVVGTAPAEAVVEEAPVETAAPTTTEAPAPETTVAPTTTAAPATTAPATTAAPATTEAPVPVAELDIVLANGAGVAGLAKRTADALVGLGYAKPYTTDAAQLADTTTVFFAEGFADEAAILAADLDAPGARIEPKPDVAVTADGSGADADLVVVLGPPA